MTQFKRPDSPLASRHRELGSALEDWNGVGTAWSYNSDANDEHDAYRERATLTDVSGLKKVWVRGPDAFAVVDHEPILFSGLIWLYVARGKSVTGYRFEMRYKGCLAPY